MFLLKKLPIPVPRRYLEYGKNKIKNARFREKTIVVTKFPYKKNFERT